MAGIKSLIGLAALGSIGVLFLILGCALPSYNNYWPLFVLIFYVLAPLPLLLARRWDSDWSSASNKYRDVALFLTAGIVISAFALPIVLADKGGIIFWGQCALVLVANTIVLATWFAYKYVFRHEDNPWN